jgi:hypothetical protein
MFHNLHPYYHCRCLLSSTPSCLHNSPHPQMDCVALLLNDGASIQTVYHRPLYKANCHRSIDTPYPILERSTLNIDLCQNLKSNMELIHPRRSAVALVFPPAVYTKHESLAQPCRRSASVCFVNRRVIGSVCVNQVAKWSLKNPFVLLQNQIFQPPPPLRFCFSWCILMAVVLLTCPRFMVGLCSHTKPARQTADVVPIKCLSFVISLIVAKVKPRPLKCTSFIIHTAVSVLNSILIHKAITICRHGVINKIFSKGSVCYSHTITLYERPTRFFLCYVYR